MWPWLVVCCYLIGAVAVTARLWADPAGRAQTGNPGDVDLFAWYMRYAATAVVHGRLPALVTAAMNAPQGINVMWNTSFLLPGVLLAPVTLLAGPQVSLTLALTLGFAGSAATLFWVLRRWGASVSAAALGGAVYGFSPALVNSGVGHYHLQFAVLPPLIVDAVARLITGRGHSVRVGAWLGLLCAAQLFIGEEILVYTAAASLTVAAALAGTVRARRRQPAHRRLQVAGAVAAMALAPRTSRPGPGAAAAVVAFSLDRARAVVPRAEGWRRWPRGALTLVALLAVLPLVPLPYQAASLPRVPAGWRATFAKPRLPSDAPVLALPFPTAFHPEVLRWQADTGQPGELIGGYFLGPSATGQASFFFQAHSQQTDDVAAYLNEVWQGQHPRAPSATEVRGVVGSWRTAAVVVVTAPHSPVVRVLTRLFGRPVFHTGTVVSWRLRR